MKIKCYIVIRDFETCGYFSNFESFDVYITNYFLKKSHGAFNNFFALMNDNNSALYKRESNLIWIYDQ